MMSIRKEDVGVSSLVSHNGFVNIAGKSERGIRRKSEVPIAIFSSEYAAIESDRNFARTGMPPNTKELNVNGTIGWFYAFTCALGKPYSMFVYFDNHRYQVKCVSPDLESDVKDWASLNPWTHVFSDGRLCLESTRRGCPTIQFAYATSVIWATGFSCFQLTGKFPFTDL